MVVTPVVGRWYPAQVVLDGQVWRKRYVLLAKGGPEDGLWVYQRPDDVQLHAAVNWGATRPPRSERAARAGFEVHLADGRLVVVTAGGSCRCGSLGRWAGPSWARSVAVVS